jgi:hypothetical protein
MQTTGGYAMNETINGAAKLARLAAATMIVLPVLIIASATIALAQENDEGITDDAEISFDGLERIEASSVAAAYIDPEADFSVFQRVAILDPFVTFRSNWQRDVNRSRRRGRINTSDMERIKADVASLFKEVFTERLEADDGFEVVVFADYDVLLLRPAIVDLDITAPDTRSGGRSRTYIASAGAATLYIELFDSVSGTIIGRAIDRRASRIPGRAAWAGRVTNTAEARRMFRGWADILRDFLEQHYYEYEPEAEAESEQ